MNKKFLIGIDRHRKGENTSKLIYSILKDKYNSILFKDKRVIQEDKELIVRDGDIDDILKEIENIEGIIIVDTKEEYILNKLLFKNRLDLIVNIKREEAKGSFNINLYEKLNRSGTIIANGDSKYIYEHFDNIKDKIIITYGLSSKATLTTSSIGIQDIETNEETLNICLQRGITTKYGEEIEPMEFPIRIKTNSINEEDILPIIGTALLYGISTGKIQDFFCNHGI